MRQIPFYLSLLTLTLLWLSSTTKIAQGQPDNGGASAVEQVTISYQTELSALAHYIARERGFYDQLGLNITMKWYPSGAPQVREAVDSNAWDMGAAGVVPNILGGSQGILNIGISMDQSSTNQLVGNAEGVANWPPKSLLDTPIVVAPNSTGAYVVQACLRSLGYNVSAASFMYEPELSKAIEDMTPGTNGETPRANLGGLWAPHTYRFMNAVEGAATICAGSSVYATVTGGHMVRQEFAEEKPKVVALVLAGWLRAVEFINNDDNLNQVLEYMDTFFFENGVNLTRSLLELDLKLVGLFDLEKQLELMERRSDPPISSFDRWTNQIGEFLMENNVFLSVPEPSTYIRDRYMKMVNEDEFLRAFATMGGDSNQKSDAFSARISHWFSFQVAVVTTALLLKTTGMLLDNLQ